MGMSTSMPAHASKGRVATLFWRTGFGVDDDDVVGGGGALEALRDAVDASILKTRASEHCHCHCRHRYQAARTVILLTG